MTKYEFVVRTSNYGFPCEPLGQGDGISDATTPKTSIMHDRKEWKIYWKNDNDEETLWFVGSEDEAFEKFYEILLRAAFAVLFFRDKTSSTSECISFSKRQLIELKTKMSSTFWYNLW